MVRGIKEYFEKEAKVLKKKMASLSVNTMSTLEINHWNFLGKYQVSFCQILYSKFVLLVGGCANKSLPT